jgi:hypothetical protein
MRFDRALERVGFDQRLDAGSLKTGLVVVLRAGEQFQADVGDDELRARDR